MARFINSVLIAQDDNGDPVVGAKLTFFETGTSTLKTIYSDSALTIETANPQTSVAGGRFIGDIFLDGIYKTTLEDENGVTLEPSKDPVGDVVEGQLELWISSNTYNIPEITLGSDDNYYRSLTDGNQGNDPISSPINWEQLQFGRVWNTNVTYSTTDSVYGSDGFLYFSKVGSNAGNDPVGDVVNWTRGAFVESVISKTTTYPVTTADDRKVIDCDSSGGAFSVTLPAAATAGDGFTIGVKKTDSSANAVTIDADGSEEIDGVITKLLYAQYDYVLLVCDGAEWFVISNKSANPSFSVHRNGTDQTGVVNVTYTKIQFTTEDFDTNSNFDNVTNYRFTPTVAGKYLITCGVSVTAVTGNMQTHIAIYKNGSLYKLSIGVTSATISAVPSVSAVIDFNGSTDYVEFYGYHDQSTTISFTGTSSYTYATGTRI